MCAVVFQILLVLSPKNHAEQEWIVVFVPICAVASLFFSVFALCSLRAGEDPRYFAFLGNLWISVIAVGCFAETPYLMSPPSAGNRSLKAQKWSRSVATMGLSKGLPSDLIESFAVRNPLASAMGIAL